VWYRANIRRGIFSNSKDSEPSENWQPLEEHLKNVAEMARPFAETFWGEEMGLSGWCCNMIWGNIQLDFQEIPIK
jgi:heat shock protein HslJ